jgi:hypothetical protein
MSQVLHPYFGLSGEFDPDEITRLLEIQPSWVKRIGDPGPPDAIGPRLGAEWCWQPEDDDSDHVGDQLAYLAGALSLKRERVAELSTKFFGTFHVYNQDYGADRDWFLSAQTLRLIADLHVDIECENIRFTQDDEVRSDAC